MSRIGKKPVTIPAGTTVSVSGRDITVQGKNGTLKLTHRPEVTVTVDKDAKQVVVERKQETRASRAFHGMTRALLNNMVVGVSEGFRKELEVLGVGWTAQVQGRVIKLNVGYADTRQVDIPMGVNVEVQGNKITVSGADRQAVGQCAARIRSQRKPEPYNGKGIKYSDEHIIRKQGKASAAGG